jgi:hypothetical protein
MIEADYEGYVAAVIRLLLHERITPRARAREEGSALMAHVWMALMASWRVSSDSRRFVSPPLLIANKPSRGAF